MIYGVLLIVGFILVLIFGTLLFLEGDLRPPILPEENLSSDSRVPSQPLSPVELRSEDEWNARRNALVNHFHR